jgi:hypothetical protein
VEVSAARDAAVQASSTVKAEWGRGWHGGGAGHGRRAARWRKSVVERFFSVGQTDALALALPKRKTKLYYTL